MEKEFIPSPEALELKELGFNEPCFEHRDCTISLPIFSQAFRWFRENYGLFAAPNAISYEGGEYSWFFEINSTILPLGTDLGETDDFETYEEAELACLRMLIEIVKTNKYAEDTEGAEI